MCIMCVLMAMGAYTILTYLRNSGSRNQSPQSSLKSHLLASSLFIIVIIIFITYTKFNMELLCMNFQCAIVMVMPDDVDSIWNYSSSLDGYRAEFASNVDMQRLVVTVTTVKKASIEIPRSQWLIERFVNVSNYIIFILLPHIYLCLPS